MNELANIISSRLRIPVDSAIDFGTFAEILYNNRNIGTVQIVRTPGNLIIDTSPSSVNNIKWDYVYNSNQAEIDALVLANFAVDTENIVIVLATFKRLYIRNLAGDLIGSVTCNYENGQWQVTQD